MKICKNKGKTTIVASRQGNMWHLWNGGDRKANASKAGMTKGGKQLSMTSRAKPAPETEATCARRLWPPRQGRRRGAARQPRNPRCRQPQPTQPSNEGGPLRSAASTLWRRSVCPSPLQRTPVVFLLPFLSSLHRQISLLLASDPVPLLRGATRVAWI
jgi:hypothetical protein